MTAPDWSIRIDFYEHGAVVALPLPLSRAEAVAMVIAALGYDMAVVDISERLGGLAVTTGARCDAWRKELGL